MKILNLFLLLISLDCYSQITFNKKIELSNLEFGGEVLELTDGYLVSGYSKSKSNTDFDVLLIKLSKEGEIIWTKYLGDPNKDERPNSITKFNDKGFLISATQDFRKTIIYRINNFGDSIWKTRLDINTEIGKSITLLNDSSIICLGSNELGSIVYRLDTAGNMKSSVFLDSVYVSEICNYGADQFALIGTINIEENNTDIYYAILNTNLEKVREKKIGGKGLDNGYSIAIDKNKEIYLLGEYDYQIIDYGKAILTLKINFEGDTIWQNKLDWILMPKHICVDSSLNCYFSSTVIYYTDLGSVIGEKFGIVKIDKNGTYQWYEDFDGQTEFGNNFEITEDLGFILVGYENQDIKALKLDEMGQILNGIKDKYNESIILYPNPVNDLLTIQSGEIITSIRIISSSGRVLKTQQDKNLNFRYFPNGLYIISIYFESGEIKTMKVIKE